MKRKKALISGFSGFVGRHLTKALEEKGIEAIGIPRSTFYNINLLKDFFTDYQPDYIFHLAAYGNIANQTDLSMILQANIFGTANMLSAGNEINYKGFVNVSSSSVLLPHETFYSATKAGAERLCKAFVDYFNNPIVTIRPYSLYGEGEADFRFIPTVIRCIENGEILHLDPMPIHDWVYVEDFVNEMIRYAQNADDLKGLSGNFGTGIGTSNAQIVTMLEKIAGKKVKNGVTKLNQRPYDNQNWVSKSIGKTISLEEGLRKTYEYYKQGLKVQDIRN